MWIAWESQRRSRELASYFGCSLHEITVTGALRYPASIFRTVALLLKHRPRVVFVQNPSMVLASLVVFWSLCSKSLSVVDRHTTFLLNRTSGITPWLIAFRAMHRFTLRYADVTIVTNAHLAQLVREAGGNPVVLPDKLPTLAAAKDVPSLIGRGLKNVLLISSFADDEPISEVVDAMSLIRHPREVHLFISGRVKISFSRLVATAPTNVTFTNYLSEADYVSLVQTVDVVVALTTSDHTMLCGCYEAVAAGKPLVTSDKEVLREYFTAALFADNSAAGIAAAIDAALGELEQRGCLMRELREELVPAWLVQAARLDRLVESMSTR